MKYFLLSIFIHIGIFLSLSSTWKNETKVLNPHVHSSSKVIHISLKIMPEDVRDPVKKIEVIKKIKNSIKKIMNTSKEPFKKSTVVQNKSSKIDGDEKLQKYFTEIREYIEKQKYYPKKALRMRHAGEVVICLDIDHKGDFHNIHIKSESPYVSLNNAALSLIQEISKFKPLPKEIGTRITLNIPIQYALR